MSTEPALPSLVGAAWLADKSLQHVMSVLDGKDGRTLIVGGTVRNALMGIPVSDVDLATELQPEEVVRRVEAAGLKAVPTGIAHGTVTVVASGKPYEVTTLRHDIETDGRRAKVRFTDDWAADASRRDFTINALYLTMGGVLVDPLGGASDILSRRVRFIGNADDRIAEDYLRILRFFRFSASFAESGLDPEGLAACIRGRNGMLGLSAERVHQELLKLLAAARPLDAVTALCDTGIFSLLAAGVPHLMPFARYLDIEHEHALSGDALRRLCILACVVTEDAERLGVRLRLSRAEEKRLAASVSGYRDVRPFMSALDAKRGIYHAGPEAWRDRVALAWCRSPQANDERWSSLYDLPSSWSAPALPWSGKTLAAQGIKEGPGMGRLLKQLEELWISADFPAGEKEQALILDEALEQFAD